MLNTFLLAFSLFINSTPVQAQQNEWSIDESYYSVGDVEINEVEVTADDIMDIYNLQSQVQAPKNMSIPKSVDIGEIINIGQKVWKVIVDNKPVVNVELNRASALPSGIQNWFQMENWQDPVARKYKVVYKNLYGIEVVKFEFLVTYSYNGQFEGRGKYLSEVGFVPSTVSVAWMYNFNASSQVVRTVNVGSSANPIAGLELNLNWVVKTPLKEDRRTNNFYIRGDGGYRAL